MKTPHRLAVALSAALLATGLPAFVHAAPGPDAAPIAVIKSDAPLKEKADACRELARVGGPDAVPALAALLDDGQLAHLARYALEPMPDPSAGTALRDALARLKGRHLAGVIASVGMRRDAQAVDALAALLQDADVEVAGAAALALGKIGNPAAGSALQKALAQAAPAVLPAVADAGLRCADTRKDVALYEAVAASAAPDPVRLAATRGAILAGGPAGLRRLIEQVRSDDARRFALALRVAREMSAPELTKLLAAELGALPPDRQIGLLKLLGDRADTSAVPAVVAVVPGATNTVRAAAATALGQLGDPATLPLMIDLIADADPAVASAARAALSGYPEARTDAAILSLLDSPLARTRLMAIGLAGQRRMTGAIPALLKSAADADAAVSAASLKVLADLAGPAEVPALIGILRASATPQAESTLAAACTRLSGLSSGRLVVKKATYGAASPGPAADVTEKVAAMVKAGARAIDASNTNFGDTAPGLVKQLAVDYLVDGQPSRQTVPESATLTFTASAMEPACVAALRDALAGAAAAPKLALLRTLRSSGDPRAIVSVRAAAAEGDPVVRDGALRILCDWPSEEALADLRELAKTAADPKIKVLALRGFIRLMTRPGIQAAPQIAALGEALGLAERNEEKLLVVSALGNLPRVESLALLAPCLANPGLKEEASLAAVGIAEKIPAPRPAAVTSAMEAVAQATANPALAARAKALLPPAP